MSGVRWILFAILYTLVSLFLQSTLLGSFLPLYLIPHFTLLLVIFLSFYELSSLGATLAFLIGLLVDISAGGIIGPSAAACVLIYGILTTISDRIFIESLVASFVVTLFTVCIYHLVYLALASSVEPQFSQVITTAIGQGAVTGLLASSVFTFLSKRLYSGVKRHERIAK